MKVANAPCSWGALEFDISGEAPTYQRVLDEISATGYVGTELGDWGFMPTDPKQLNTEIAKRNLSMLGAFVPVQLVNPEAINDGITQALKTAHLLKETNSAAFIVLSDDNARDPVRAKNAGRIQPEYGLSLNQWQAFAKNAELLAKTVLEETGVKTVFHHHCAGYVETPHEIETLLHLTNPALLGLCLDTGHYAFGGGNPLTALKNYRDRIWHVHFKDFDPLVAKQAAEHNWDYFEAVEHGVFCELGQGNVDFKAIAEFLKNSDYSGWIVVEQDVLPGMGTPYESAQRNRDYLKSIGL